MTAPRSQTIAQEALHAIGALFEPGDVIEIRAVQVDRTSERAGSTYSGYFDFENRDAIVRALERLNGRAEGVYVVLNRLNPTLLARAKNRLQVRPKHTTADSDITKRRWLYIDCDPTRPAGISATDAEHEAALERVTRIRSFLASCGWPEPIYCDSGNGGHLLYLLPELDVAEAGELVKACLRVLARRFSDSTVKVDESTANAARLCKLYGTQARKGDPVADRPHRYARILEEPDQAQPVPVALLKALAAEGTATNPTGQSGASVRNRQLNIDQWLTANAVDVIRGPEAYDGGRRWILRACIFNTTHEKPAIIELANGALVYSCLHKSCSQYDWKAFRERIAPTPPSANTSGRSGVNSSDAPLITDLSELPSVWTYEAHIEWCVEEMFARGSVNLICSESGVGKTWLGYYVAGCVAHGIPVIGRRVSRSKVLYIDGENPLCVVKKRLFDLGIEPTDALIVWGGWNAPPPEGPHSKLIIDFARRHKPLIIFDSLIEFHPGSEQSSSETRAFMRNFRLLAHLGATIIVLHHSGKSETAKVYRGSSDIKAAVDTAYHLESVGNQSNQLGQLSLKSFKGRLMPGKNFGMEFRPKQGFIACEGAIRTQSVIEVIAEILEANPRSNQGTVIRLGRARGCSKSQLEHALKNGHWRTEDGAHNSTLYSVPATDGDEDGVK